MISPVDRRTELRASPAGLRRPSRVRRPLDSAVGPLG